MSMGEYAQLAHALYSIYLHTIKFSLEKKWCGRNENWVKVLVWKTEDIEEKRMRIALALYYPKIDLHIQKVGRKYIK